MKQNGFTLIELIVVIVILGILAATVAPKFINLKDDAERAAAEAMAGAIAGASHMNYGKAEAKHFRVYDKEWKNGVQMADPTKFGWKRVVSCDMGQISSLLQKPEELTEKYTFGESQTCSNAGEIFECELKDKNGKSFEPAIKAKVICTQNDYFKDSHYQNYDAAQKAAAEKAKTGN